MITYIILGINWRKTKIFGFKNQQILHLNSFENFQNFLFVFFLQQLPPKF